MPAVSDPSTVEPGRHVAAPRDALEFKLKRIWEEVFSSEGIGIRDDFFEIGGDSLRAIELLAHVEITCGRTLTLNVLTQAPTIEQLANVLRNDCRLTSYPTLVPIQPEGVKPPFFFVHPDKIMLGYRHLASHLGPGQPVYELHAQSAGRVKTYYADLEDLAAHYVDEIRSLRPAGPYYLGGFCFGGLIALAMARRFFARGEEVAFLALFDCVGPNYPTIAQRIRFGVRKTMALAGKERPAHVVSRAKAFAGRIWKRVGGPTRVRPSESAPGAVNNLASLEGDSYILLSKYYSPQTYPGRLTLFRSTAQAENHAGELNGWGGMAAMGITVDDIPSTHMHLFTQPAVTVLAEKFKVRLEAAQSAWECGRGGAARLEAPTEAPVSWAARPVVNEGSGRGGDAGDD